MKKVMSYFKVYKKEAILAPLCKLLEASLELLIPILVSNIIDHGIANSDKGYIIRMVIIMVLCGFVGLGFSILGQFFSAKCAVGFSSKLRSDLFKKLQSLSFSEIDNLGTSSMITRMTSDVNQVQTGINLSLRLLLRSPFVVFGAAIMGTVLAPNISYIYWIAIPVLSIVIFGIIFSTMPLHKHTQEDLDNVLGDTRENLAGTRVVRAFTMESDEIKNYKLKTKKLERSQNNASNISNLMNPLTYIIINIAIVLLIYLGGLKVDIGDLTQGQVIALYNYMSQILIELIKLANLIITIAKAIACAKRIEKVLDIDTTVNITDDKKINDNYIEYNHVTLTYKGASEPSLEDINFSVKKGETIGIIGSTGSGKSSIVHLIPRFYEATCGQVILNGKDITSYDVEELRSRVGIVMQKAVLFEGTIKENIKWGKKDATDEEILKACEISQSMDIINKKEKGINSFVEQSGRNFSGGQRQRLSIARALVRKPEILILDDSSSALDYATDAALRKSIKSLDYHPTVFIVSQRTASIQNADKILVLDDGKMMGFDTHDNLLKNCQVYQEIYYSQFKKGGNN
ncbi:MAG: ABC transporter ATP-binding protein/permease [Acholeplasmataceae bacterium]|nr:ABC transporter ATP-binding protein/permease [Acholeplasmataceae bacterium]